MSTQSELAQIQHILGKRRGAEQNPLDLSARKKSREYLDSHKDVEKRRRDRINTCLETIRTLVPLCHQLPRHRRVDKADLLDLAIIYLRMVNKFLEKLGVTDIFSAAHQQMGLFTSLEKWVRQNGEKYSDVPSFTKEIISFLETEMETASHVIASEQTTSPVVDTGILPDNDWVKHEQGSPDATTIGRGPYSSLSGSDEESSSSCHGEANSNSEDSLGPSPNNYADSQRMSQHFHPNDPYSNVSKKLQDCECTCTRLRTPMYNDYHGVMRYASSCHTDTKPVCVDKAVNTDANLTNSGWPPNTSFTLPIISGKIVLHTAAGPLGSNNLNAPVTVHAEIHSTPDQDPCQSFKPLPQPPHDSEPQCEARPVAEAPPENQSVCMGRCKSRACSLPSNQVACPAKSRASPNFAPLKNSIIVPVPGIYTDGNCNQVDERPRKMFLDESSSRIGRSEEKYYAPLMPVASFGEDRNKKCPTPDSFHRMDHHQYQQCQERLESCLPERRDDEHFSRRFHTSLCQQLPESSNNINITDRSQHPERLQTTSSSLKLKSLMVHRHQAQRILSR